MAEGGGSTRLAPVDASERIGLLDALRGIALAGIYVVNIEWFSRPWQEFGNGMVPGLAGIDLAVARAHSAERTKAQMPVQRTITIGEAGTKGLRTYVQLFVLIAAVTLFTPRVPEVEVARAPVRRELLGFVAMLAAGLAVWGLTRLLPLEAMGAGRFGTLAWNTVALVASFAAALWAARAVGFPSFVEPWDAFFDRRKAIWLLALIVLYKMGDAFAGSLTTTFLIRGVGFSATEVGSVNKVMGLSATIVGALLGGAWLAKRSLYNALMVFGIAQAVSNLGYWVLSVLPQDLVLMAIMVGLENLCGGMGTAAFVAFLMALTDRRFSAAQYALLSALASVGRVYVGPASGVLVAAVGWPSFYLFTVLTALPGIALLWWLRDEVRALSPEPEPVRS